MTFKTRELTVDLVNEISTKEIRFSQGDENSAKLVLNITNEGQELDLSQAKSVRITFKKPDGTTVFQEDLQPINAMKGKYQIILKTQTLAAAGNVYGQVRIFETDRKLDAEPFVFTVKHSYSGDTVVESTNEFTIIQKALEVGEKFKGVDFAPIINAGALAANALPKAGGTVTGTLNVNSPLRVGSRDGTKSVTMEMDTNGKFWMGQQTPTAKNVVAIEADGTFNVIGTTNVYKKTDLYSKWVQPTGYTNFLTASTDLDTVVNSGLYGGNGLVNAPNNLAIYFYIEVITFHDTKYVLQRATSLAGGGTTNQATWVRRLENNVWGAWEQLLDSKGGTMTGNLNMNAQIVSGHNTPMKMQSAGVNKWLMNQDANGVNFIPSKTVDAEDWDYSQRIHLTNLVKKSGDTMTGDLSLDRTDGGKFRDLKWSTLGRGDINLGNDASDNWRAYDTANSLAIFSYNKTSKTFNINAPNTNLVTKTKDGQVDLVVTADGTAFDPGTTNVARRRGNTVTLRISLRRNVGSTDSIVATIPTDMRPSSFVASSVIATDGTVSRLTVEANGNIKLSAVGKDIVATMTYVVD